jgi:spore maturation protein A
MLNYIWIGLILLGILAAVWTDVGDIVSDKYRNETPIHCVLRLPEHTEPHQSMEIDANLVVNYVHLQRFYGEEGDSAQEITYHARLIFSSQENGLIRIRVSDEFHPHWKEIARSQPGNHSELSGTFQIAAIRADGDYDVSVTLDPIRFISLQRVTNDGIVGYAGTAVTIAIGLIGIMALWLGVMKVAEEAGLVQTLARGLKPVMTRLFPDVPAEHPAMGAMILNIAANMLGLANAATPLGLKAMEELNKLNKKAGTATDAMCTFLVINTSSVQLIPATAIAIRASAGSANPTEIIVPVLIATTCATIAGIVSVKLLQRLPVYRKQLF